MCGRFALKAKEEELARKFLARHLKDTLGDDFKPRYNIAPSQPVLAIRDSKSRRERVAEWFTWGLVPSWAKDPRIAYKMINARSETAARKPAFRKAFQRRRCLIPASGFFEWKRDGKRKQPFYITARDESPLAFAGLWEVWEHADGSAILSTSILTTGPNAVMEPIHDRMPVILTEEAFDRWLDRDNEESASLQELLKPCDPDLLTAWPVSTVVNSPRNDSPLNLQRVDEITELELGL